MKTKGYILILTTAFISGFSIFINKMGVSVVNPYIFTGLKNLLAALCLAAFIFFLREWQEIKKLRLRQWGTLVLIGLVGGSIPFLLFFKGLSLGSAAMGGFIHKTMFIYVAILAATFLKEKINKRLMLVMGMLLCGTVLLLKITPNVSFGFGELLIVIATILWAVENVISKYAINQTISPRVVALGRMFFGFLFILGYWAVSGQLNLLTGLDAGQLSWVWLTGLILFGYVATWYSGLKYIKVSEAACILALGAPITSVLQILQGQVMDGWQELGVVLMVGAVGVLFIKRWFFQESLPAMPCPLCRAERGGRAERQAGNKTIKQ